MLRFFGPTLLAALHIVMGALSVDAAAVSARRDIGVGETEWKARMTAGQKLEIKGVVGHIDVSAAPADEAVRFKVRLPAGVGFLGRLTFGDMALKPGPGDLQLETQAGTITVTDSGSGHLYAKSGLGKVEVVLASTQAPAKRTVNLNVLNGDVRVVLPAIAIDYSIAKSLPGGCQVQSEIPLKAGAIRDTYDGTLGSTEPSMTLHIGSTLGRVVIRKP